jgi:hypothetical protein
MDERDDECLTTLAALDSLVSGGLRGAAAALARRHLARCLECARAFDDRMRVREALARAVGSTAVPPSLRRAIRALVRVERGAE